MKNSLLLIAILWLTCSCDENELTVDPAELTGTWQVVEVLSDPGDGSGTFMPIDSDKTMSFFTTGMVRTNADFCDNTQETDVFQETTYSVSDSVINVICDDFEWEMPFEIEGDNLILYYLCIEPCAEKYEKITN